MQVSKGLVMYLPYSLYYTHIINLTLKGASATTVAK